MAELAKKKKERAKHRSTKSRLLSSVNEELAASPIDEDKIAQLRMSLGEKLKVLRETIDEEILGMTSEEGDLDREIEQADVIKEEVHLALVRLDKALRRATASTLTPAAPVLPPVAATPTVTRAAVKLPHLTLQQFDGELMNWIPFWDSYKAAVHDNGTLSEVEKFNYLRGLLRKYSTRLHHRFSPHSSKLWSSNFNFGETLW